MPNCCNENYKPVGPSNQYTYFIGPNPRTSFNPVSILPTIDSTAFVGPFSSIIGNVTIDKNVFIACNAVLRADEGTPFYIGCNTNIQDHVVLHGVKDMVLNVNNKNYSIYISKNVSCAHSSIIHGPCIISENVFVGVNAVVFNAIIEKNAYIGTSSVVTGGVTINEGTFVPPGSVIDTQAKANKLGPVPKDNQDFAKGVLEVNYEFPNAYLLMFGAKKCSCGLCCNNTQNNNKYKL